MTFVAEAPTRRRILIDAVVEAYFELYLHLDEDLRRRRAFQRAFQRGREKLTSAANWPDAAIDPDIAVAIAHLLDSAPSPSDAPDAILAWLDLLPGRLIAYIEPAGYELLIEEREPFIQTGIEAAYPEWRTVRAPRYWDTRLSPEVESTPAGAPREVVAA